MTDKEKEFMTNKYYENNAAKLRRVVDKVLSKFGGITDRDHYYSLANEVFVDVLNRYDGNQDFNGFLYSCLLNKVKTELTRQHREKRKADTMAVYFDSTISEDSNSTYGDIIASDFDLEEEAFGEVKEDKVEKYLDKLSKVQRNIVELLIGGYKPIEIREILHMSNKMYSDNMIAIQSFENVSILM